MLHDVTPIKHTPAKIRINDRCQKVHIFAMIKILLLEATDSLFP